MKLSIMQPYFFPYIGYFQLIKAVDKFIFYDDVNFIKNGWINRNRILINNAPKYFTIQLKKASSFKLINEVEFTDNREKLKNSIHMAYKKAPYYYDVRPLIDKCLELYTEKISDLAIASVKYVCEYLELETNFEISSINYPGTKYLEKEERIKEICNRNDAKTYINPIGGMELYNKKDFKASFIDLYFLKSNIEEYQQFKHDFIPGLSIIDVMMFNSREKIHEMLDSYELI